MKVKDIYDAPITTHKNTEHTISVTNTENGTGYSYPQTVYEVRIQLNGKEYCGIAYCAPEDEKYASELVGCTIAHMRAALKVMQEECDRTYQYYLNVKHFYHGATLHRPNCDVTYRFKECVKKAEYNYLYWKRAIKRVEKELNEYLISMGRAFDVLERKGQK